MAKDVSFRTYVIVWAVLMGLALASFLASLLPLGEAAPVVALGVGLAKAVLIATFFMHLIEQPSISRWAFGVGILLAAVLLLTVTADVLTREPTGIRQPGLTATAPESRAP